MSTVGHSRVVALRLVGSCLVIAALTGCGGSTEPDGEQLAGTYQLVSVNGGSLPYEYKRRVLQGMTVSYRVDDAQLEFRSRNRVYDIRKFSALGSRPDTMVSSYRVEGMALLLSQPTTPGFPAYTDSGTIDGSTITIRRRHLAFAPDINAVFVYTRAIP